MVRYLKGFITDSFILRALAISLNFEMASNWVTLQKTKSGFGITLVCLGFFAFIIEIEPKILFEVGVYFLYVYDT